MLRVSRGLKAAPNDQRGGDSSQMYVPGSAASMAAWDQLAQDEVSMQSQRAMYAPTRDLDMELVLLRKLEPAAAASLEHPSSTVAK